ncbi:MAG: sugar ABC transporter permease [Lachnospiraceae bacterium]|nr:sugar ABC transporter permease [Lachnospiraceae bacterium]
MAGKEKVIESKSTKRIKKKSLLFIGPSFLGVCIFFIAPMIVVMGYSMMDNPIRKNFVFLDNFRATLANRAFRLALSNTAKFSALSVPLVVILSLLVAMVLENIPGRMKIRSFLLTPMMVPIASVILIWQVLFNYNGVVNEAAARLNLAEVDWLKSDKALIVIVLLFVWKNLGYNMILFMAAIANIPAQLMDAARLDGGNEFQIFFKIKIRYLASSILFVTILSIINSFKVFREIYLLTGDYPFDSLYILQTYMNNMFRSLDYQKLSSAAILMSLIMIVLVALLFIAENYVGRDLEE